MGKNGVTLPKLKPSKLIGFGKQTVAWRDVEQERQ